jgi:hypothetical protein
MKKLVVIAVALFTINGMAQEKRTNQINQKGHSELMKQMTPNDIADLKTKRLTLKLDLNDEQQKKVHSLILNKAKANENFRKERRESNLENKEKLTKDEFVKIENHKLDQQIKMKREMKMLLTPEQYTKFEKMKQRHHKKRERPGKKR